MGQPPLNGSTPPSGQDVIKGLLAKYPKARVAVYVVWMLATTGAGALQPFSPDASAVLTTIAAVLAPFALATAVTNMNGLRKSQ